MHRLVDSDAQRIGTEELRIAFESDDPLVGEVIASAARLLGIAIANWVTVLALDTVLLGGGIMEALGARYLEMIRAAFEEDVFPDRCRACSLRMTALAADAGLLGAALLARDGAKAIEAPNHRALSSLPARR
jgi:glucokinase